MKCSDFFCKHLQVDNYTDPIVPALAIPTTSDGDEIDPSSNAARTGTDLDISDANIDLPELDTAHLPHCPTCKTGLLRPGVVWFGERLPADVLNDIDSWMEESEKIDLIMVIGTSAQVYPAAGYVDDARAKGARVAVVNMDGNDIPNSGIHKGDWFFVGDAAKIVPELFRGVIGEITDMPDAADSR